MSTSILSQEAARDVEKSIRYSREDRDYSCYLIYGGEEHYIGSRGTYSESENLCNTEYYRLLERAEDNALVEQAAEVEANADDDDEPVDMNREIAAAHKADLTFDRTRDILEQIHGVRITFDQWIELASAKDKIATGSGLILRAVIDADKDDPKLDQIARMMMGLYAIPQEDVLDALYDLSSLYFSTTPATPPIPTDVVTAEMEWLDGAERTPENGWMKYESGNVWVTVEGALVGIVAGDGFSIELEGAAGIADLRALSYILEHPDIRRLVGKDVPPVPPTVDLFAALNTEGMPPAITAVLADIRAATTAHEARQLFVKVLKLILDEAEQSSSAPALSPIPADVVTVTQEDGYTDYRTGNTSIAIKDGRVACMLLGTTITEFSATHTVADLRALSFLLEHADVRRAIDRDVLFTAPGIMLSPIAPHDPDDDEPATTTTFRLGGAEVDIESDGEFAGKRALVLDGYYVEDMPPSVLQDAITLLNSPQVKRAQMRAWAGLPGTRVA